jgi:outer membrane protein assembly factor BamB
LLWKYNNTNSGLDTPWGLRPIFLAAVADGKVYAFNNEHSPNSPLYKGQQVYCIDAYTGEEIWTMFGWAGQTGGRGTSTSVLADGYFVYYNYYDNSVYCVGKGPTATTVTAPNTGVPIGNSVLIQGTVIDMAAGTKQTEQTSRFPNGVPAVSDECMMLGWSMFTCRNQPADVTGVSVHLTATTRMELPRHRLHNHRRARKLRS